MKKKDLAKNTEQKHLLPENTKAAANKRRTFIKQITLGGIGATLLPWQGAGVGFMKENVRKNVSTSLGVKRSSDQLRYQNESLEHVAFPIGGLGAGMFCLEGMGAISHMSVRNHPDIFNEPGMFATFCIKEDNAQGTRRIAKMLEGAVASWKIFGPRQSGLGDVGKLYGLPRFAQAGFESSFPFGRVHLQDEDLPVDVEIEGWSPFIPADQDNSGLPAGSLHYKLTNKSKKEVRGMFSFHSRNFLADNSDVLNRIEAMQGGFVLHQDGKADARHLQGDFAVFTDHPGALIDHCWFRGNWWDPLTTAWNTISEGTARQQPAVEKDAPGASIYIPVELKAGQTLTIPIHLVWYCPFSEVRMGAPDPHLKQQRCFAEDEKGILTGEQSGDRFYRPWYSARFKNIAAVVNYYRTNLKTLLEKTRLFNQALYASTLPGIVMEAVTANLSILKSPTILRQYDGRLWCWEGCEDWVGSCHGSCTHVWNYAQATAHLFPALERSLRDTEFCEDQNPEGHQNFRANMPISPTTHDFHAAADGQLGGIMKIYRDWRISGDNKWLEDHYPKVKASLDYCIRTWDPGEKGRVEEPHHNTYDIEFWGPDGMCNSFYLGALTAMIRMGRFLHQDVSRYESLFDKGKAFLENELFDGEYFFQRIEYKQLKAEDPTKVNSFGGAYSAEAVALLKKEGPKYQYGKGCLSDGILGAWIGQMCGLDGFIDAKKVTSHLLAVHKYNLKNSLMKHANPQRPGFALGDDGGLLLCSWPKGGKLSLPFVYSDEVWTGIEYQVASHLMLMGKVKEGLDIVQACRGRYNGRLRNPFDEYECGHFYGRALSSFGLLQGLTGLRYDAVEQALFVRSQIGDFACFLSTETGFGTVTLKGAEVSLQVAYGNIPVKSLRVNGKESPMG